MTNPDNDQTNAISDAKRIIKSSFELGHECLKILSKISEITPESIANKDWKQKFAIILNYFSSKMPSKSFRAYKFPGIESHGLRPLDMITSLIKIYLNVANCDEILEEIVADERSYSEDTIVDLGRTSYQRSLFPQETFEKLEVLQNKLIEIGMKAHELKDV